MAEYVLMKLTAGEEVMAQLVKGSLGDGSPIVVKSPRMLVMQQTQQGMGVGILPYSSGSPDGEHTIASAGIQSWCDMPPNLEKAYIENTSNIKIVSG